MVKIWKSKEVTIKHDAAADVTINETAALDTFFSSGTEMQGYMKNVTIVEPESDVNSINLLGVDSGGYTNQELDEQPYSLASITGTAVLSDAYVLEQYAYGTPTNIPSASTTHRRFYPGKVGNRTAMALLVNLNVAAGGIGSGTNKEVSFALDNAWVTKLGDTKLSDVAGHFERDITVKCLPKDFYGPEFYDDS